MPSEDAKIWTHIDKCEPINRKTFELCLAHKKIIEPMDLNTMFSVYDDGFYGDLSTTNPENSNLFLKVNLSREERVVLRKILKASGNPGKLREIDSYHTEDSAHQIDLNTKHLARLTKIQIWVGVLQLTVALTTFGMTIIQHLR